jgi:hypothetical protein
VRNRNIRQGWGAFLTSFLILLLSGAQAQTHVIEVLADKDSRYKIAGERTPEITVKTGEPACCGSRLDAENPGTGMAPSMDSRCFVRKTGLRCPAGICCSNLGCRSFS